MERLRKACLTATAVAIATLAVLPSTQAAAAEWTELGPNPISAGRADVWSQWGTTTGRATALVVDPTDADTVYIGASQGGVWRTTDGGEKWVPLFDSADTFAVHALALAPDGTLWVGTGSDAVAGNGLYRIRNAAGPDSTVEGPFDTRVLNAGTDRAFSGQTISTIALDPGDPDRLFVGTKFLDHPAKARAALGLYYTDAATGSDPTFTRVDGLPAMDPSRFTSGVTDAKFVPRASDAEVTPCELIVGVAFNGAYRLTDSDPTAGGCQPPFAVTRVIDHPYDMVEVGASGDTVYVATSGNEGTLWKSIDRGKTFSVIHSVSGWGSGWHQGGVGVDPANPDHVFLGGYYSCFRQTWCGTEKYRTLVRSIDGGRTWHTADGPYEVRGPMPHAFVHPDTTAIVFAPTDPNIAYTTNDGGVYRADNALTTSVTIEEGAASIDGLANVDWKSRNTKGFGITQFYSLAVHPRDPDYTLGGSQDNGAVLYDPAGGHHWALAGGGDVKNVLIDSNSEGTSTLTTYVGCNRYGSTAEMLTMASARTPGCSSGFSYGDLGPQAPSNRAYHGVGTRSIRDDTGAQVVSAGWEITAFAVNPHDGNEAFVAQAFPALERVNLTTRARTRITGLPNRVVTSITFDPSDEDIAYVGFDGYIGTASHVYRTTNLTASTPTWTAVGSGLPDLPVRSLIVDPRDVYPRAVYLGTDNGVFAGVTSARGEAIAWSPLGEGLPRGCSAQAPATCPPRLQIKSQRAMAIAPVKRVLRIATYGRGMWEIALPNSAPEAVDDSYDLDEDTELDVLAPGVLANDRDPERAPITAELVEGPEHGTLEFDATGRFGYTPVPDYAGQDSFTYRLSDGRFTSQVATVTLNVLPVNDPPTAAFVAGRGCSPNGRAGTLLLTASDIDNAAADLTLSATSSDPGVVPAGNFTFGGTGADRTVTVASASERATGTALIAVSVSDGTDAHTLTFSTQSGGNGEDTLNGTPGSDVLLGQNGDDRVSGLDGHDVLCGGNGTDVLTGGEGADHLGGGLGVDTPTDVNPAEGDSTDAP